MAYKLCISYGARVPYTLHKHAHTKDSVPEHCGGVVTQSAEPTHCTMSTTMLKRDLGTGDLCDNIGLVGVSAKWSYVTASPSHHDQAIPILSPLLFMHVGHPYILLFKIRRIFEPSQLGQETAPTHTCIYIWYSHRHPLYRIPLFFSFVCGVWYETGPTCN